MVTEREDGDENGNKIKIGNYDVLLQEMSDGTLRIASEPATHVGNNRLEVLLLMSRSEYKELMAAGEATFQVVENVIEIVTTQCVPPGRFLLPAGKEDVDKPHRERLWGEVSLGQVEKFIGLALLDGKGAGLGNFPEFSKAGSESAPPDEDSTKKRGRRSSLLRRSVSESIVRLAEKYEADGNRSGADGKKKGNHRSSSLWSIRKEKSQTKVTQTEDLDVLLNFEQTWLLPNHVGNNRLKVLLNIHKEKYENSTIEDQTSSLQEWIRTVTQFWGGRFLRQLEGNLGGFEHLDTNQAELALHSVISEISQSSDDVLCLSAVGKSASVPILGNVPHRAAGLDVQDMRSAAVQSLQKRKKRQGLVSRLRNLAAATLTRTTSNSARAQSKPEAGGLGRFTSAPSASCYNSGGNSLPTSPTPPDEKDPLRNSGRVKRSNSITLPRFLTGRASLRRSRELAEVGALKELEETLEVDGPVEGPEAFGEYDAG
jgi:hypothetical protein